MGPAPAHGRAESDAHAGRCPARRAGEQGLRADPLSAMTPRFNLFFRLFARRFFRDFDLDDATVARLRELEQRGAVVYVMRYASRLDYFLFNTLFRREGLRLSGFANGIRFWYYRPLRDALRTLRAPAARRAAGRRARARARVLPRAHARGRLAVPVPAHGEPAARSCSRAGRGASTRAARSATCSPRWSPSAQSSGRPVFLVPLALFWRKGPRARRRFLNLSYGALTRPNDVSKVLSFLTTYRGLHVKVGDPIDVLGVRGDAPERERARARARDPPLDPHLPLPLGARGRGAGAPALPPRAGDRGALARGVGGGGGVRRRAQGVRRARAREGGADVPRDRREHELDLPRDPRHRRGRGDPAPVRVGRGRRPRARRRGARGAIRSCSCPPTARTSTS